MRQATQERCDHCGKFVGYHIGLFTLEDIVSEGVKWEFGICSPCFDEQTPDDREYWDNWVIKQNLPANAKS